MSQFCRCESAGSFSNKLYERVLLSLLRSPACNSELLGTYIEQLSISHACSTV